LDRPARANNWSGDYRSAGAGGRNRTATSEYAYQFKIPCEGPAEPIIIRGYTYLSTLWKCWPAGITRAYLFYSPMRCNYELLQEPRWGGQYIDRGLPLAARRNQPIVFSQWLGLRN
jgi:hypothetical protein